MSHGWEGRAEGEADSPMDGKGSGGEGHQHTLVVILSSIISPCSGNSTMMFLPGGIAGADHTLWLSGWPSYLSLACESNMFSWSCGLLQAEAAMLVLPPLLGHLGKRSPFPPRKNEAGRWSWAQRCSRPSYHHKERNSLRVKPTKRKVGAKGREELMESFESLDPAMPKAAYWQTFQFSEPILFLSMLANLLWTLLQLKDS